LVSPLLTLEEDTHPDKTEKNSDSLKPCEAQHKTNTLSQFTW